MNGRIFDPVLGRFLSADPNIDGVSDSQGYNRYSYVHNNPLNATDPTGYLSLKDVVKIAVIAVAAVVTAGVAMYGYAVAMGGFGSATLGGMISSVGLAGGWGTGWAIAAGAGAGFGTAFAGSLLNGASVGDAFRAGAVGALTGAVAGGFGRLAAGTPQSNGEFLKKWAIKSASSGTVEGLEEELSGGKFSHGFKRGAWHEAKSYPAWESFGIFTTEEGEALYPNGGPTNPQKYDKILVNGIIVKRDTMQDKIDIAWAKGQKVMAVYNPTNGGILDVMQTGWEIASFGLGDSLATSVRQIAMMAPNAEIQAHSQGTVPYMNAVIPSGFRMKNPAVIGSPAMTQMHFDLVNYLNGGHARYNNGRYQAWGDVANLYGWSYNPLKILSFPADIFRRGHIHSANSPFP